MKPFLPWLAAALIASAMPACKKDTNSNSSGTKLSKVIVYTLERPTTTVKVYGYRYDAMNRVTDITFAEGDSVDGEAQTKQYESTKWFYNGNEQKPYKSSGVNESFIHYDEYYGYDNNDRLVYDSTDNSNFYEVIKYNWSGNKIIRTIITGNNSGVIFSTSQDSSVISGKAYLGIYNPYSPSGNTSGGMYTYDNKTNPLHLLNIHVAATFTGTGGLPTAGYNENNITEVANGYFDTFGPGPVTFVKSQIISYKYNYNAGSLPVDCEITGNLPITSKVKFFYN